MSWRAVILVLVLALAASHAAPMAKREADDEALEKFEELKSRLEELKNVLKDLGNELEKEDAEHVKREKVTKPNDELDDDIKEIVDKISPDDIRLLREYSNKAHYFLNAVKENPNGLDPDPPQEQPETKPVPPGKPETEPVEPGKKPAPGPGKPETEPAKREKDAELEEYISHLSEEDQRMLKGMKSKLHYLKDALHTPGGNENDKENEAEPAKREESTEGFSKDLQPEDIELLQKLKERLKYLKGALKEQKENAAQDVEASPDVEEGDFGEFVKKGEVVDKKEHWEGKALPDSQLGAEEYKDKRKCGAGDKRCEDKDSGDADDDDKNDFAAAAEKRFMEDVDFAREHGVKITDLLRALKARKVEQLRREEKELEQLSIHGQ